MLLNGHDGEVFCCKFNRDGKIIATAGFERKIFLWNVYGETFNWGVFAGHNGAIMDIRFSSDNK